MLRTARITIMASRASIIHLVILSTPFFSPMEQIRKPTATTITIQKVSVPGLAFMELKMPSTSSVVDPTNRPLAVR